VPDDFIKISLAIMTVNFLHDGGPFFSIAFQRKNSARIATQCFVGITHRALDILRVVIASTNDDHIFDAARHE